MIVKEIKEYRINIFKGLKNRISALQIIVENPKKGIGVYDANLKVVNFFGLYFYRKLWILNELTISGFNPRCLNNWFWLLLYPDRYLVWGHGFGMRKRAYLIRWIRIFVAKRTIASLFYTDSVKCEFASFTPSDKLFVARNTISYDTPAAFFSQNDKKKNVVIYFGDLRPEKGVADVIYAHSMITANFPDLVLLIIGDGIEKDSLVRLSKMLGSEDKVIFRPRTKSVSELSVYLQQAKIVVSPKHVGLSVVEAFRNSLPIVTYESKNHAPEYEYCINNENSIIIPINDVQCLAAEISSLLNDKERLQFLSLNAFNFYENYLSEVYFYDGFKDAIEYATRKSL